MSQPSPNFVHHQPSVQFGLSVDFISLSSSSQEGPGHAFSSVRSRNSTSCGEVHLSDLVVVCALVKERADKSHETLLAGVEGNLNELAVARANDRAQHVLNHNPSRFCYDPVVTQGIVVKSVDCLVESVRENEDLEL